MWSALLALVGCGSSNSPTSEVAPAYATLLKTMYKGTVPLVTGEELVALQHVQPKVVLLDARSPAEYNVSHLPGARFVDYDSFRPETLADVPREQPVVVYCSVGVRSERVGEQLKAQGYTNVRNLYGGIFQWVNEARPVVNTQGQITERVHPYSALWGAWLTRGEKTYQP